jgi:hypothetical protein
MIRTTGEPRPFLGSWMREPGVGCGFGFPRFVREMFASSSRASCVARHERPSASEAAGRAILARVFRGRVRAARNGLRACRRRCRGSRTGAASARVDLRAAPNLPGNAVAFRPWLVSASVQRPAAPGVRRPYWPHVLVLGRDRGHRNFVYWRRGAQRRPWRWWHW